MSNTLQEAAVSPDSLIQQVEQLDDTSLGEFLDRAYLVQAQRRVPHLSEQETELLLKINTPLDEKVWQQYTTLYAKLEPGTLTEAEHAALLELIDVIEIANAERIENLTKLAALRGMTLKALMKQMGIGPRPHG